MNNRKKIAFFLPAFKSSGGAEKQITILALGLADRDYEIHALSLFPKGQNYDHLKSHPTLKTHVFFKNQTPSFIEKIVGFLSIPFKMRTYLKNHNISLCVSVLHIATFLSCLTKIIFPHFKLIIGLRTLTPQKNINSRFFYRGTLFLERTIDGLITNSHPALSYAQEQGFKTKNTSVILNGFNADDFYFSSEERQKVRENYSISSNTCLLGYVGRLAEIKGLDLLISALPSIIEKNPTIKLLIVGDGKDSYKAYLQNLVTENGLENHILFAGEQQQTRGFYSAFDLFILPSKTESFPNVIAEAFLCELPVIASDCGNNKELIDNKSLLFGVNNQKELETALLKNLTKAPLERNIKGREKIVQNYSISSMIDAYEHTFKQF